MKYLLAALALTATTATAQTRLNVPITCNDRQRVADTIQNTFKEEATIAGVVGQNSIMNLWINYKSGDWTLTLTTGETSCVVLTGENFTVKNVEQTLGKPAVYLYSE